MNARAFLYAVCLCASGGAGVAITAPALADVKAGVDAWAVGDFAAAVREWRGPAAQGDPDAQFNLAQAYRLGRGVEANPKQAEVLYAKAAAQGHLKAADNYGLLLFQDGRREAAMPYLTDASARGDPRAQYLIGLAHFNGDLLPKDWVRAYALLTLSNSAGLPQAGPAIKQMDEFIPRAQREQAQTMAQVLKRDADALRSVQLAAVDLGAELGNGTGPNLPVQASTAQPPVVAAASPPIMANRNARIPEPIRPAAVPPSMAAAQAAIEEAARVTGTESPANAGADYARPVRQAAAAPAPTPKSAPAPAPAPNPTSAPVQTAAAQTPVFPSTNVSATATGPWKVQLGAFSVNGNAEKLWSQLSSRSELSGKTRLIVPVGGLTKLLAWGYPSRGAADQACASLKRSGQGCLVTR